jgi:hypothetical protein
VYWHHSSCNPLPFPDEVLLLVGVLSAACILTVPASLLKMQFFISAQRADAAAALCTFKHACCLLGWQKPCSTAGGSVAQAVWVPVCMLPVGCSCLMQPEVFAVNQGV